MTLPGTCWASTRRARDDAGLRDARAGRPPYFWAILTDPLHRRDLLREGWKAVARIFVVALDVANPATADRTRLAYERTLMA